jgi:hypothetical protein
MMVQFPYRLTLCQIVFSQLQPICRLLLVFNCNVSFILYFLVYFPLQSHILYLSSLPAFSSLLSVCTACWPVFYWIRAMKTHYQYSQIHILSFFRTLFFWYLCTIQFQIIWYYLTINPKLHSKLHIHNNYYNFFEIFIFWNKCEVSDFSLDSLLTIVTSTHHAYDILL